MGGACRQHQVDDVRRRRRRHRPVKAELHQTHYIQVSSPGWSLPGRASYRKIKAAEVKRVEGGGARVLEDDYEEEEV